MTLAVRVPIRLQVCIGILSVARFPVSPARCGERSESEANFCARSAVRLRGGRVAGGRSAIRNGICPLQTLLPRLLHPKTSTSRLYVPPTTWKRNDDDDDDDDDDAGVRPRRGQPASG
ncbi:hypothetical protein KM043_015547 [Ampulex compressa]|nr:hypothetical protein KM043_015547 [Ampulex compressa]